MERVYIFDTTLRDGGQTKGVDFSFADKIATVSYTHLTLPTTPYV